MQGIQEMFEMLSAAQLSLSAVEVVFLLIVISICLLFRLARTGLIAAFLFVYRWGWMVCEKNVEGRYPDALIAYFIFGAIVAVATAVSLFRSSLDR